jgi:hypothetical protein
VAGVKVAESLAEALAMVAEEPLVLVAGSLYLIGEAMQRLGVDVDGGGVSGVDERRLNDWGGGR